MGVVVGKSWVIPARATGTRNELVPPLPDKGVLCGRQIPTLERPVVSSNDLESIENSGRSSGQKFAAETCWADWVLSRAL